MIFTARSNSYLLSLYPHKSFRVPAIRSGPSTRTSNVSRTAIRTTPCSTNNPSGRPSRCSARPFLLVSHILVPNDPCATAGEMLCEYHHALMHGSRLISSSSQFKASYPSCTPSFDHSPSPPLHNPSMTTCPTSYSLSSAGVALSFGFPLYVISPEPPFVKVLRSYWPSLTSSSVDEYRSSLHTRLNLSDDSWISRPIRRRSQRLIPSPPSLAIPVLSLPHN